MQTILLFTIGRLSDQYKSKLWWRWNQLYSSIKLHFFFFFASRRVMRHSKSAQQYLSSHPSFISFFFAHFVSSVLECSQNHRYYYPFFFCEDLHRSVSSLLLPTAVHSPRKRHCISKQTEIRLSKVVVVSFCWYWSPRYLPALLLLPMMILVVRWPVRVRPFCLLGVRNWSFLQ